MAGRRPLAASLLLASVVALACLSSAAGARSATSAAVYRVRPDPRACPSPACGGFWAGRVNRSLTTCLDGKPRASCYVATVDLAALSVSSRARARSALRSPTTLVTGAFSRYASGSPRALARLVAARVWIAAGPSRDTTAVYRVVDTGVRCVRAPCFSLRATVVNGTASTILSSLDLSSVEASGTDVSRAHAALTSAGVLVAGAVRADPQVAGGRVLVATQFWLPA